MIYIILNAALAAFLIFTAVNINTKNQKTESVMVNIMLLNVAAAGLMFCALISVKYGPERLSTLLNHSVLFFVGLVMLQMSAYFLSAQKNKRGPFLNALTVILGLVLFAVTFFKVNITDNETLTLGSQQIFNGQTAKMFPITWLQMYTGFFMFLVPGFSILIMLLKAENSGSRLAIQRAVLCLGSLVFGWVGSVLIYWISFMLPMMRSLSLYVLGMTSILVLKSATTEKIYDGNMIFSYLIRLVVEYIGPALVGGMAFVVLRPVMKIDHMLYYVLVVLVIFLLMEIAWVVTRMVSKVFSHSSSNYEHSFEQALANINYEVDLKDICESYVEAFRQNVGIKDMTVLVDSGTGDFVTGYSSNNLDITVPSAFKGRDILMNDGIFILFRDEIETNYRLVNLKNDLYELYDKTEAQVMIVLHEGNHILGIIFLSEKKTGSSYDEYDKQVFDRMYSYFFVFGYYLKNIANASVIGTVNREIRMSSQIITSIQENMDHLKNPKIDVGYLMVPAHNIGGEFVDFIRLSKTRHIMIIGSLSGRGISASMSMVILKSIIRTYLADTHDFKQLIQKINYFIRFNLPKGTYFAGMFCLMDFETDTMYYINCGSPALLMYSKAYNNIIEIQGKGYVLGFVKDISPLIKVKQYNLTAGDMFTIATNGLISSHSLRGEQFGKDRIKQVMMDNYTYPANRIVRFVYDNLQQFMSKELEEDITLMVCRYMGKDGVAVVEDDEDSGRFIDDAPVTSSDDFDAEALFQSVYEEPVVTQQSTPEDYTMNESPQSVVTDDNEGMIFNAEDLPEIADFNMDAVGETVVTESISEDQEPFDFSSIDGDDDMFKNDLSQESEEGGPGAFNIDDIVDKEMFDPDNLPE